MSVAFWSVKLTNGKAVEVQPPEGYVLNVQQAAYVGEAHTVVKVHTTSVEGDKLEAVICTLRSKNADQVSMSLVFGYDVPVAFSAEGKGEVYLSGYYQPGPEEDDENDYDDFDGEDEEGDSEEDSEDDDEEDDEEMDEEDEEANIKSAEAAIAKLGAARKNDLVVSGKKAIKNAPQEEDSEDDDEEEDSEDDDSEDEAVDNAFIAKMIKRNGLAAPKSARVEELDAEEDDSEDDEEDSVEDSEEEESEEEAPPMKVQKGSAPKGVVTASGQKSAQQQQKPTTPSHSNNSNQQKPKTPQGGNQGNNNKTPQGKPNGNNFNKTPNSNNKGGNNNQNSGFKSGDKRKR